MSRFCAQMNISACKQLHISLFCLLGFSLFLHGFCVGTESVDDDVAVLEKRLCELGAKAELSDELITQFYVYAFKRAKKEIPASDDFWKWVAGNEAIRSGLFVGLHPNYNPDVIKHLQELKNTYSAEVDQYPQLALAFAFVFGAAKDKSIKSPWVRWTVKDRPVPTCCESFAYYVKNKDKMLFPLTGCRGC